MTDDEPADDELLDLICQLEDLYDQGRLPTPSVLAGYPPELVEKLTKRAEKIVALNRFWEGAVGNDKKSRDGEILEVKPALASYRPFKLHARGGLGEVFLAHDVSLGRDVALKLIQEERAHEHLTYERFSREARITARLQHPGVVPVYAIGAGTDGRPYYAMRFIAGETLRAAIVRLHKPPATEPLDAKHIVFQQLIRRFLSVCETMAYVHQLEVLHRDLKPSNIILGPYGETLVVDWGLAKDMRRADTLEDQAAHGGNGSLDSDITFAGQTLGTPSYMSPEQAAGAWAEVGRQSDVYSLGATLFEILTGQSPFPGSDLVAVIDRVRRGDLERPRRINPRAPAALEAVCLKTMARLPEGRYADARELADEIERWLADSPVHAYREPWAVRARRWRRRHRALVTGVSAATVIAVIGLAVLTIVLTSKNRQLDKQRTRAEDRERLALDAVKRFRDVLVRNDDLRNRPDLHGLRQVLLREPLDFFRELRTQIMASEEPGSGAPMKLISANVELAETTRELGDPENALRAYNEALGLIDKIAMPGNSFEARTIRARILNALGDILRRTGRVADAMQAFQASLESLELLSHERPADVDLATRLANAHNNVGILLAEQKETDAAIGAYQSAIQVRARCARDNPTNHGLQARLADSYYNLGIALSDAGRVTQALGAYQSAIHTREQLSREHPEIAEYQMDLANNQNNLGALFEEMNRPADALQAFRAALAIREKLTATYPSVNRYRADLSTSYFNVGHMLGLDHQPQLAQSSLESAERISRQLAADFPAVVEYRADLGRILTEMGDILAEDRQWEKALVPYHAAIGFRRALHQEHASLPEYHAELALSQLSIGHLLRSMGRDDEATGFLSEAAETNAQLAHNHPTIPDYPAALGASLAELAKIEMGKAHWTKALELLERALPPLRTGLAASSDYADYRKNLEGCLADLARVCLQLGSPARTLGSARELASLKPVTNDPYLDTAGILAGYSTRVPTADAREFVTVSIELLKQAIASNKNACAMAAASQALKPLRVSREFQELVLDPLMPSQPFSTR
jgi:eukaryotic-like serine/threonine-protein kinase